VYDEEQHDSEAAQAIVDYLKSRDIVSTHRQFQPRAIEHDVPDIIGRQEISQAHDINYTSTLVQSRRFFSDQANVSSSP
tara:strand:+ start:1743 stop:1979 length:237 start_codon:yes stop_codon:yes gene_type:complete